jgi:molybdenum cofactor guanylyltransferase
MTDVVGVILAGGLSRRMGGGDKGLKTLGGRSILERVIERVRPQVDALVLNANGDPARFAAFGLAVVPDGVEGFPGPLAGVLAGLEWARMNAPQARWVASFPGDAPFVPRDLVARFLTATDKDAAELACARSGDQEHPVVGLWPVRLADALRHALAQEGMRKVDRWTARYRLAVIDFADQPVDPFFNANTPEDLAEAERALPLVDLPARD